MPLQINYLEHVKGIRFAISYSGCPQNPTTLAEDSLLQANFEAMGVKIEPSLSTTSGSSLLYFNMVSYTSKNLCYLVKADSFSSIEELKSRVLKGFNQHVSSSPSRSLPQNMEYVFSKEYSSYHDENEEKKLGEYLEARSKRSDVDTVPLENNSSATASASSASFFNSQISPPAPKEIKQQSNQDACCTIL